MGYYTDYDISSNSEEIQQRIEEVSDYGFDRGQMNGKWYRYQEDVKQVSLEFPDEVIVVEGDGEEQGDVWKHYFKNGKSFKAQAVVVSFEDFDEGKLK